MAEWVGEGGGGRLPITTYTGRRCPKGSLFQFRIDYSTLFLTFGMDKRNKSMERTPLTRKIAKSKSGICWKPTKFRQILRTSVWWGPGTNLLFPSPPSTYKSLSILATLQSYIFARLGRTTFSFGNFTATEIKIKLLLVLDMCQRPWYDVIEMIVCTKKK